MHILYCLVVRKKRNVKGRHRPVLVELAYMPISYVFRALALQVGEQADTRVCKEDQHQGR